MVDSLLAPQHGNQDKKRSSLSGTYSGVELCVLRKKTAFKSNFALPGAKPEDSKYLIIAIT
jgi:hypothetical protein